MLVLRHVSSRDVEREQEVLLVFALRTVVAEGVRNLAAIKVLRGEQFTARLMGVVDDVNF